MLNNENYFSQENQLKYMGSSQFKAFMKCEAAALAEIKGEYVRPQTTALLVGSYIDSHFEGTLDVFIAKHPELFTRSGTLKAEYSQANEIIERIERDEMFMNMMSGEKQVIKTGEIGGVPFKIKIDSYHPKKLIVDLKIVKDFNPIWDEESHAKKHFIDYWGYDYQAAIYQAVEGNHLPFFIAAATKEKDGADLAIFSVPEDVIEGKLFLVEQLAKKYDNLKHGIGEPSRCEHCAYCKATKVLSEVIDYTSIGGHYND